MKVIGKIWKFIVLLFIILIVAAFLIPYIYEDEIKAEIKKAINDHVDAKVDFKDVNLSLIKSFPKIALDIEEIQIIGINEFENITLFDASYIRLNADLTSVLNKSKPVSIASIEIENADINAIINESGAANYDIIPPSDSRASNDNNYELILEEYAIRNSSVRFIDLSSDLKLIAEDINHTGNGNLNSSQFDLITQTQIDQLSVENENITYLSSVKLNANNTVKVNTENNEYSFNDNSISLNALLLNFEGKVKIEDDMKLDIKFNTPNSSFSQFVSAIPNGFRGDFKEVDASGKASIKGLIKGIYNSEKNLFPSFQTEIILENGKVKFPESPMPIEKVNAKALIETLNGRDIDIEIPQLSAYSGKNMIEGTLLYNGSDPNPVIQSNLEARLDLEEINKAFPFEGMNQLSGRIDVSKFKINSSLEDIENQNFENIVFEGKINLTGLNIELQNTPPIKINSLEILGNPKKLEIHESLIEFGKSDMTIDGFVNNPLAYFVPEQSYSGSFDLYSNRLDLNEWMSEPEDDLPTNNSNNREIETLAKSSSFDISLKIDSIHYDAYTIMDNTARIDLSGKQIDIKTYKASIYDNPFEVDGSFENLYGYVMKKEVLDGVLNLKSEQFNVNPFLEGESSEEAKPEAYRAPLNMNVKINTDLQNLVYQKLKFQKMIGSIELNNGTIRFNEVVSKALGGDMNFEGLYDSNIEEPLFSLKYDLSKLSFKETFESLPVVNKLAGIMEFIDGVFNSTLVMEANLNDNMFPNLSTLNAQGFIQTLTGKVKGLEPLDKIGEQLGIQELKSIDISNTKNWFEIVNGTVGVKPEEYTYKGINLLVSGTHAYDQDMSYTILAQVPRSKFKNSNVGNAANSGLKFLEEKASKLGVDIDQGEFVNFKIELGGSILKPKIKITPMASSGKSLQDQVKDEASKKLEEAKDTLIDIANQKTNELKDTISEIVENKIDTISNKIKNEVNEKIDTLQEQVKDKVLEKADTLIEDVLGESLDTFVNGKVDTLIQGKLEDILGDKKTEEVDKIKTK